MKGLVILAAVLLVAWGIAEACGPWYVLRAALNPVFWQPFRKTIPDAFATTQGAGHSAVFAGMAEGGRPRLAEAREAYRAVARWRGDQFFQAWDRPVPLPDVSMEVARQAVESALAAGPSPVERDELGLIRCKVSLREAESLLLMSRTKVSSREPAAEAALRKARDELVAYLSEAKTPGLVSEARGWLARCHYLLGDPHKAARIYLDELGHTDSALARQTLLASLRLVFPYDESATRLADHLDEYFDTPQHALFVIDRVTNPLEVGENKRRAMASVGRKALAALERHRALFSTGAESDRLALAAMRASLYMGDAASVLRVERSLPAGSQARTDFEGRWMLAIAHFLLGHYSEAEPHLIAVADSSSTPPLERGSARLGLLAVYQKLARPVDQLVAALRHEAYRGQEGTLLSGEDWYPGWWPYDGWLMDLSYLLDVQLTEEELKAARERLVAESPMTLDRWGHAGRRPLTALFLLDYELAVRAARREAYEEASVIYDRLGASNRARRMRKLMPLHTPAQGEAGSEEHLRKRYTYGASLADQPERVFFNDVLWDGLERYAFLDFERDWKQRTALLSEQETHALLENERAFKDAQEERWQAYLILDDVVERAGHSELGRQAARKAIECLDRINMERFGRESEIQASRKRLASCCGSVVAQRCRRINSSRA